MVDKRRKTSARASARRRIAGATDGSPGNLDRKNPRAKEDITHLPPAQLAADILKKEQRIAEIMGNIQKLLAGVGETAGFTPMTQPAGMPFSDYIVFVDETGDHSTTIINRDFPSSDWPSAFSTNPITSTTSRQLCAG